MHAPPVQPVRDVQPRSQKMHKLKAFESCIWLCCDLCCWWTWKESSHRYINTKASTLSQNIPCYVLMLDFWFASFQTEKLTWRSSVALFSTRCSSTKSLIATRHSWQSILASLLSRRDVTRLLVCCNMVVKKEPKEPKDKTSSVTRSAAPKASKAHGRGWSGSWQELLVTASHW